MAATAVMSLANPFGGALAQLIDPSWADDGHPEDIPNMILYIAIIVSLTTFLYLPFPLLSAPEITYIQTHQI